MSATKFNFGVPKITPVDDLIKSSGKELFLKQGVSAIGYLKTEVQNVGK